jgi:hypothetical protein
LLSPAAELPASGVTWDAIVYVCGVGAAISVSEVGTAPLHKHLCQFLAKTLYKYTIFSTNTPALKRTRNDPEKIR